MIIDCISDLHGDFPDLDGGDLLILAGDLTGSDKIPQWVSFFEWLVKQEYKKKVFIGGNHDCFLQQCASREVAEKLGIQEDCDYEYLWDSGTEFEGWKIWGSPWTRKFEGQNPACMAFALDTEEELAAKFALIPEDTDILITHSPPLGILDETYSKWIRVYKRVGSEALLNRVKIVEPLVHVFGHIHGGAGELHTEEHFTHFVNAAHMNEYYEPINKPIRIIL